MQIDNTDRKKKSVFCDIDGTISDDKWRRPIIYHGNTKYKRDFDAYNSACVDDKPNYVVLNVVKFLHQFYNIVLITARPIAYQKITKQWLGYHCLKFDALYMRPENNLDKDSVVKYKLMHTWFETNNLSSTDVAAVFEDKPSCIEIFERMLCFQIIKGDKYGTHKEDRIITRTI